MPSGASPGSTAGARTPGGCSCSTRRGPGSGTESEGALPGQRRSAAAVRRASRTRAGRARARRVWGVRGGAGGGGGRWERPMERHRGEAHGEAPGEARRPACPPARPGARRPPLAGAATRHPAGQSTSRSCSITSAAAPTSRWSTTSPMRSPGGWGSGGTATGTCCSCWEPPVRRGPGRSARRGRPLRPAPGVPRRFLQPAAAPPAACRSGSGLWSWSGRRGGRAVSAVAVAPAGPGPCPSTSNGPEVVLSAAGSRPPSPSRRDVSQTGPAPGLGARDPGRPPRPPYDPLGVSGGEGGAEAAGPTRSGAPSPTRGPGSPPGPGPSAGPVAGRAGRHRPVPAAGPPPAFGGGSPQGAARPPRGHRRRPGAGGDAYGTTLFGKRFARCWSLPRSVGRAPCTPCAPGRPRDRHASGEGSRPGIGPWRGGSPGRVTRGGVTGADGAVAAGWRGCPS